jgi:Ca-activated chloride channel homolog
MNFVVNDLAVFVARRLRDGGHRDAPPLAPPSKGGEALRNTRGGKSSFVTSQVFNSPPLAPPSKGGEAPRNIRGAKAPLLMLQVFNTPPFAAAVVLCVLLTGISRADNPDAAVRDGLRLYRADEFDKAREKFAQAREQFGRTQAGKSAIAAFDEACASHRKHDVAHARECYLEAGLAHDKGLAAAAHFNLGTLASEEARKLAGEHPESVAPEKRQEIVDQLKSAVASFRHSLELQPENARARRDIELVRQWIKYYGDKWQAYDREKRRRETNLIQFLEFLIETQRVLRESVKALTSTAPADAFAELKRLQDELQEEITPLKEKIKAELQPQQGAAGTGAQGGSQELEKGIALLQRWAEAAGEDMQSAGSKLLGRQAEAAASDQQSAIDEMEKIWDAVIPFHPLLARDLADQTQIAGALKEADSTVPKAGDAQTAEKKPPDRAESASESDDAQASGKHPLLGSLTEDLARLAETQERTQRRTQLLKLKAEAELARVKEQPPVDAGKDVKDQNAGKDDSEKTGEAKQKPVDPEKIKAGYRKAIELAPQAAAQMERAAHALRQKDRTLAYGPAEEARKILEEIQKAQPPSEQQKQDQKDQEKKKDEQQKQDQKDEEKKKDEQQKKEQKKDQEKKKQDEQSKSGEGKQEQKQQFSRDQIEQALRKVRERQQEKRERDRKMNARVIGRAPVEKDW